MHGQVLTYFPTFVAEFNNVNVMVVEGWVLIYFPTFVAEFKMTKSQIPFVH